MQNASSAKVIPVDDFFKNEQGVLSNWEIDNANFIKYYSGMEFFTALCGSCCIPLCILDFCPRMTVYVLCAHPNIRDLANSQHVCLTDDGVNYTVDQHKAGCRLYCCDVGKVSKLVTYEKITDVTVEEPAGADWCGLVPRILYTVSVQTAGLPVQIVGLKQPHDFKKEVMRIKKSKEVKAPTMEDMMRMMTMQQQQQQFNNNNGGQNFQGGGQMMQGGVPGQQMGGGQMMQGGGQMMQGGGQMIYQQQQPQYMMQGQQQQYPQQQYYMQGGGVVGGMIMGGPQQTFQDNQQQMAMAKAVPLEMER